LNCENPNKIAISDDVLSYIKNNRLERQRLVGLKYEQLEELIQEAIANGQAPLGHRFTYQKAFLSSKQRKLESVNKEGGRKVKSFSDKLLKRSLSFINIR